MSAEHNNVSLLATTLHLSFDPAHQSVILEHTQTRRHTIISTTRPLRILLQMHIPRSLQSRTSFFRYQMRRASHQNESLCLFESGQRLDPERRRGTP